jgi:hypothetical protein
MARAYLKKQTKKQNKQNQDKTLRRKTTDLIHDFRLGYCFLDMTLKV